MPKKIIHTVVLIIALAILLGGCTVPFSYPSLIGREDLHLVFDITIENRTHSVDFTSRVNDGATESYFSDSFLEISFFDHYIELFDGYYLSTFILHIPADYVIGETYTRDDYDYDWGGRNFNAAACLELDTYEFWVVLPGLNDNNGSSISVTVEGDKNGYIWGTFEAVLEPINNVEYATMKGSFSSVINR